MMKKMWKNRSGVSPVIATILMVAITVVLAAVLYVMVMGFGSGPDSNPTVSLTNSTTQTANTQKVMVASISESQTYANMKVSVVSNGTAAAATVASGSISLSGLTGVTVQFIDIASDGKVSTGDYFLVTGPATASMTLSLLFGSDSASLGSTSWTA